MSVNFFLLLYSTVQYSTVQYFYCTVQVQYSTVQLYYSTLLLLYFLFYVLCTINVCIKIFMYVLYNILCIRGRFAKKLGEKKKKHKILGPNLLLVRGI